MAGAALGFTGAFLTAAFEGTAFGLTGFVTCFATGCLGFATCLGCWLRTADLAAGFTASDEVACFFNAGASLGQFLHGLLDSDCTVLTGAFREGAAVAFEAFLGNAGFTVDFVTDAFSERCCCFPWILGTTGRGLSTLAAGTLGAIVFCCTLGGVAFAAGWDLDFVC